MKIESFFTCAVVCPEDRVFVARSFLDIVTKRFDTLKTELHGGSTSEMRSDDIVVPVVEPADCAAISRQILLLKDVCPQVRIVPLTVRITHQNIGRLLRAGACDFIAFPFEYDECVSRIQRVLDECASLARPDVRPLLSSQLDGLVGVSPKFREILELLPKVAGCDSSVLLLGETGTGKEVIARAIHYCSSRKTGPWVAVDCGAIPGELIESELFGHVQGAFTNAHRSRIGLAQEAQGGTLLLDEIDALPLTAQSKLLRFIQEKEYRQVGSNKLIRADVRIIAASNQNLAQLVEQGRFRRDLYFRLNIVEMYLPALRERAEDVRLLALYFMTCIPGQTARPALEISESALAQLLRHDWPGNVRELRNAIERAVWMASPGSNRIERFDLGKPSEEAHPDRDGFQAEKCQVVTAFEISYITRVLASCDGNITRAAKLAGKNRRAFFALIQKHHIDSTTYRKAGDLGAP